MDSSLRKGTRGDDLNALIAHNWRCKRCDYEHDLLVHAENKNKNFEIIAYRPLSRKSSESNGFFGKLNHFSYISLHIMNEGLSTHLIWHKKLK